VHTVLLLRIFPIITEHKFLSRIETCL